MAASRLLATWQRSVLWGMWLGILCLLWRNTSGSGFTFMEFIALAGGTALTVWMCRHPMGGLKEHVEEPSQMRGCFESRVNWAMVIFSAHIFLLGVGVAGKMIYDLRHGLTTIGGIFEDFGMFFIESMKIALSGGTSGDVTHTRLYTLIIALPVGAFLLWYNLHPWLHRGLRFRVGPSGMVEVNKGDLWLPLNPAEYHEVAADTFNIVFKSSEGVEALVLPQGRVFSVDKGTRVKARVAAAFFREWLASRGFDILPWSPGMPIGERWLARRKPA